MSESTPENTQVMTKLAENTKNSQKLKVHNMLIGNIPIAFINHNTSTYANPILLTSNELKFLSNQNNILVACDDKKTYIFERFTKSEVKFDPIELKDSDSRDVIKQKLKDMTPEEYSKASKNYNTYKILTRPGSELWDELEKIYRHNLSGTVPIVMTTEITLLNPELIFRILLDYLVKEFNSNAYYNIHDALQSKACQSNLKIMQNMIRETIHKCAETGNISTIKQLSSLL